MRWKLQAREEQIPPDGNWLVWMVQAGRGFGKTRAGAEATSHFLHEHPSSRVALVGPTWRDVRDTMIEGESGLLAVLPPREVVKWNTSLGELTLRNGSKCFAYAATQPDRLRGPQHHFAWGDELAAWERAETWDVLLLGLRLGKDPKVVLTTTPKPRAIVRAVLKHPRCVTVRGSTYDNIDNLPPDYAAAVLAQYEGSRMGRQEIMGELLEDVEGALWTLDDIDKARVPEAPDMLKVVVAIDPAGGGADEVGIVAVGMGKDRHGYVLADRSGHFTPERWAKRAVDLYRELEADKIVVERNYGGDMVKATIQAVDKRVPISEVVASRGKRLRAEPISTRYEQGLVHHVGVFTELEDQMIQWTADTEDSPDRVDALVWGLTDVLNMGQGAAFLDYWKEHPLSTNPAESKRQAQDEAAVRQLQRKMGRGPRFGGGTPNLDPKCEHRWRGDSCVFCGGQR
jgi:phage terminase large subunit-like protein